MTQNAASHPHLQIEEIWDKAQTEAHKEFQQSRMIPRQAKGKTTSVSCLSIGILPSYASALRDRGGSLCSAVVPSLDKP